MFKIDLFDFDVYMCVNCRSQFVSLCSLQNVLHDLARVRITVRIRVHVAVTVEVEVKVRFWSDLGKKFANCACTIPKL